MQLFNAIYTILKLAKKDLKDIKNNFTKIISGKR
jgi:hypothetical protein